MQALALALHELATNATKYGALKQPGGRLAVPGASSRTRPRPARGAGMAENGCAMPRNRRAWLWPAPHREGAGHTLGMKAELTFDEDGVGCRIEIPLGRRPGRDLGGGTVAEAAGR